MANVFDNAVKGYTIGLNNKLNAQKAYIDSYITGINARNAVNQEGRTNDQYYNYTQPFQASNLGITLGQNNIQQRILNDPNYQNDLFGVATSKASQANQLATSDLNNMGYYIDTQGNLAKTGALTSGYNANDAKFNLSQQDAVNKQKAAAIAQSGVMQPIQNQTALEQAQQYYKNLTNPIIAGATSISGTPTTIMLPNGSSTSSNQLGVDDGSADWAFAKGLEVQKNGGSSIESQTFINEGNKRKANGGTNKTPLPQPINQQNGQQQVPTGYESKYQYDERIRKENILKSVDTYQKLLDLAIQNGRKDDIAKYSGLLQATKNSLNNPLSNLYDRIFGNQSEADYNYQLNQRKLLGQ